MLDQMSQNDARKKKKSKMNKKSSKKRSKGHHKESVDQASYKYFKLKTECLAKNQPIKHAIYMEILKTLKLFWEGIQNGRPEPNLEMYDLRPLVSSESSSDSD